MMHRKCCDTLLVKGALPAIWQCAECTQEELDIIEQAAKEDEEEEVPLRRSSSRRRTR